MTGLQIQERLDAIVNDLQTTQKGNGTHIMIRDNRNVPQIFTLTANEVGTVNAAQLALIQAYVDDMKSYADEYEFYNAPVQTALEAFNTAQAPHEALIEAARVARVALQTALDADADYQSAKTALETARANADYISATTNYKTENISENFAELANARRGYYPFVDGNQTAVKATAAAAKFPKAVNFSVFSFG